LLKSDQPETGEAYSRSTFKDDHPSPDAVQREKEEWERVFHHGKEEGITTI